MCLTCIFKLIIYLLAYFRENRFVCLTCLYKLIFLSLSLIMRGSVVVSHLYIHVDIFS